MLKIYEYGFLGKQRFEATEWIQGNIIALNEDDAKILIYEKYKQDISIIIEDINVWEYTQEGYKIYIVKQ